jgi:dethiobiotin synthetase
VSGAHRSGIFVTGTDTGVGKTMVSTALMRALKSRGFQVAGMKPVASGCRSTPEGLRNEDALALMREQSVPFPYEVVNPFAYEPAIAPHIAAAAAGIAVRLDRIVAAFEELHARSHLVIVEGAGGWYAPISEDATIEDLALELKLPVLLVVALRLGCLNHALLTHRAIERSGASICGWIANRMDPGFSHWQDNVATLKRLLPAPLVGTIGAQGLIRLDQLRDLAHIGALHRAAVDRRVGRLSDSIDGEHRGVDRATLGLETQGGIIEAALGVHFDAAFIELMGDADFYQPNRD